MRALLILALVAVGCEYQTHDLPIGDDPVELGDDAGPVTPDDPDAGHINPAPPEVIDPEGMPCERDQDCEKGYECDDDDHVCVEKDEGPGPGGPGPDGD